MILGVFLASDLNALIFLYEGCSSYYYKDKENLSFGRGDQYLIIPILIQLNSRNMFVSAWEEPELCTKK